jgi:aryl-alcohol dehydrogenase-like predicted oxidoreductase
MRYRSFAIAGMAISAMSLVLNGDDAERSADGWRDIIHAGFEEGVNAFELIRPSPALLKGVCEGAAAVPRRLLFVGMRIEGTEETAPVTRQVEEAIDQTGLGFLDLLSVDAGPFPPRGVPAAMKALKDQGLATRLGVAGEQALLAPHIEAGGFDALITPFNLLSGWRERNMVRTAIDRQLAVIGCEPFPVRAREFAQAAKTQAKGGWLAKSSPLAGAGSYAFLRHTPGWNAEQICLGYALTEPALASVQMSVADREHLAGLSEVVERDLPAGVSAQIEMARFSAEREAGTERRSVLRSA